MKNNILVNIHLPIENNNLLTNEQKNIFDSFKKFIYGNGINLNFLTLNYLHDEKKNSGKQFEIDGISIVNKKNSKKIVVLAVEHKDYSKNFTDVKKKEDYLKIWDKLQDFKKYFFNGERNIAMFCLFMWKKDYRDYFKIFKIQSKLTDFSKVNNETSLTYLKNFTSTNDLLDFNVSFLDEKLKTPRDLNFFISCLLPEKNSELHLLNNTDESQLNIGIKSNRVSYIHGTAGSGKTSLALYLLSILNNSLLFILNKNFCKDLIGAIISGNDEIHKFSKRIVWKLNDIEVFLENSYNNFLNNCNDSDVLNESFYLIIDESQRMNSKNYEIMKKLLNKLPKLKLILLGDEEQMINPNYDLGTNKFLNEISYSKFDYSMKKCYRISQDSITKIKYCMCLENYDYKNVKDFYKIILCENVDEFINFFKQDVKKNLSVLVTTQFSDECKNDLLKYNIGFARWNLPSRENFLHIPEYLENYCFFPYDIISREIRTAFVYLPSEVYFSNNQIFHKTHFEYDKFVFLKKQIYVLCTRAVDKLVVFPSNEKYRQEIKKRLMNIKNNLM